MTDLLTTNINQLDAEIAKLTSLKATFSQFPNQGFVLLSKDGEDYTKQYLQNIDATLANVQYLRDNLVGLQKEGFTLVSQPQGEILDASKVSG